MTSKHRKSVKIAFILIITLLLAIIVEMTARIALTYKNQFYVLIGNNKINDLNDYSVQDFQHPWHWRLKAGYSQTLQQAIEAKKTTGRILAVEHLRKAAEKFHVKEDEVIFNVNSDGFKGPEMDKKHSRPRILTIGDSCTFGGLVDKYTYPRSLERELRSKGLNVEVVNAGVEGYAPVNVLYRIEEFKALKPEITTLYIGWNALYSDDEGNLADGFERYLYTVKLLKKAYGKINAAVAGKQNAALQAYNKAKHADKDAATIRRLDGYVPPFIKDIEKIIVEMQSVGSKVVIITLPGLFSIHEIASDKALKIGHLPFFTDNPYVLAKLSEQYNIALRKMAVQYGLTVIDLEKWGDKTFQPRDEYFFDSVHLYEEKQELIGVYMANELLPILPARRLE